MLYKLLTTSALFFFLIFSTLSCKKSLSPSEDISTAYLYLQAEPFSLDPRIGGDRRSQCLLRELFEGLTRISKDGSYELALAKNYTLSEDALTYTFTLHPSLWSNGDPVTASDFIESWKSLIDPNFITPYSYAFYVIKNAKKAHMKECSIDEIGLKKIDDLSFEITLEHPASYFLELLSNPLYSPVHPLCRVPGSQWSTGTSNTTYISNGPYRLTQHILKSHLLLEKNSLYWNSEDPAQTEKLHFSILEDPQTALSMFQTNQIDWLGDPFGNMSLETIHTLDQRETLYKLHKGGVYWYVVSTTKPHLSSVKIRQALAHAINREAITKDLLQGGEVPAFSHIPKEMTLLTSPIFLDNRKDIANKLFEEGLQELGLTRTTFPPLVISHWSDGRERMMAEVIQDQIQKALGIEVVLESQDWSSYLKKVTSGDLELGGFGWYSWFFDPMYNLEYIKFANSGINGSLWQNDRYIEILNLADNTSDKKTRDMHMEAAERIAMEEAPIIPIFYQTFKYAKNPKLQGEVISRLGLTELKWMKKL